MFWVEVPQTPFETDEPPRQVLSATSFKQGRGAASITIEYHDLADKVQPIVAGQHGVSDRETVSRRPLRTMNGEETLGRET